MLARLMYWQIRTTLNREFRYFLASVVVIATLLAVQNLLNWATHWMLFVVPLVLGARMGARLASPKVGFIGGFLTGYFGFLFGTTIFVTIHWSDLVDVVGAFALPAAILTGLLVGGIFGIILGLEVGAVGALFAFVSMRIRRRRLEHAAGKAFY